MRKILVVGAGQSGLQLALTLREHDYDVTVMSARTPDEIRAGRVMSTQCMFHDALQHERDHGLNLWEEQTVRVEGLGVSIAGPDSGRVMDWVGRLDNYAQSVDQRVKMAGWLELFEQRGGKLIIHGVTTADLNALARMYDLVVVAAGKGELVQLFDRDPARSPYTSPQRALSVAYVHGVGPRPEHPDFDAVRFNIVPGVGELFMIPGHTLSGNCHIMFFEGVPGGPLDCWSDRPGPGEHLERMLGLMKQFLPWEYERSRDAELTDSRATLTGGYTPVVRRPVGELPSGTAVLGMADVVVANDPITGQGSNNASKCAASYLDSILERGDQPFDRAWMERTFERYWEYARHVTDWTNAMLRPPPPHVMDILGAAQENDVVARRFVNGFSDPTDYQHWFMDPDKAADYLASLPTRT
ncbi:2-polyprenyl-6-methoxyphenol hydroxylase-like FAD-dependent oxidoreductase [Prauserella shujinwangii]|uniref:2-polyprenyl-6-methoxyphenol hydroxylase-like FAD-dependent oxidoreductase n=1 Tax=Prauserella shujinwangii TaxID=1453103 RepID=A0A2T0LQX1_9PSEU|nr:styrene monooxygenase/indole monooxygenase family protein [Prauserella shujinwangii]PRX45862.1 2-polyprenyl-6-methoxyphenol hydroxylase-like FAD-dependent oxidoreductase [Prauserella shujinwangii]